MDLLMSREHSTWKITERILKAKRAYYIKGKPTMSDQEYDALEGSLRAINQEAPVLKMVGYDPEFKNIKPEDV